MSRKGGIKVYRSNKRKHYRKPASTAKKVMSWVLVIVIMAVLVFVGYSVCDPVLNFIKSWKERGNIDIEDIIPSATSAPSESAETTSSETSVSSESESSVTEQPAEQGYSAIEISGESLVSDAMLNTAVKKVKDAGCNAAVLEFKAEGGAIYYKTASETAALSTDAVRSDITAAQIIGTFRSQGITPIVKLNLLYDNNRYDYPDGTRICSYKFASDNSNWLDNKPSSGGKPWISPFDKNTQEYIAFLADEIYGAGCEIIICDGVVFPPFHNSDLNYIGDIVKSENRYKTLINTVDIVKKSSDEHSGKAFLSVSAKDVVNGTAEVFKPDELTVDTVCVDYYSEDFNGKIVVENTEIDLTKLTESEKISVVMNAVKLKSGALNVIPVLHGINNDSAPAESLRSDGFETIFFG